MTRTPIAVPALLALLLAEVSRVPLFSEWGSALFVALLLITGSASIWLGRFARSARE